MTGPRRKSAEQLARIVRWRFLTDLLDATDSRIRLALADEDQAGYVAQLCERAWVCWQTREWWASALGAWPESSRVASWDTFMRNDLERAGRLLPLVLEARRAA